ncbi:MAG: hypothetical protein JW840_02290 [Candidatus Thermoplasmatota archaeon]|nr:hypothetical protein [Candidatus Thermoplasmatota archaeon]
MKKNLIKVILEIGLFIIFLISIESIYCVSAETINFDFNFSEPEINQVNISSNISDYVTIEGLYTTGFPSLPLLPIKSYKVLLPQKGIIDLINVTYSGNISLGNGYNITIGGYVINNYTSIEYYNFSSYYYNSSIPYPTNLSFITGIYNFRGYSILEFNLYPVHYIKETGEIYYYENMTVTINTNESGSVSSLFRGLLADKMAMHQIADNFSMENTYVTYPPTPAHSSIVDPSESYNYIIITKNFLINANPFPSSARDWYTFQDLADYKNDTGISTNIVTIDEIKNDPYYWNTSSSSLDNCNDTASQVRNFIYDAYNNWEIEYVLLGGDEWVVPIRVLYYNDCITGSTITSCPSDLYYSCLNGPFNVNNDGIWGKPCDGIDNGDVDLEAEVYVGRACVASPKEVSNFVYKTLIR